MTKRERMTTQHKKSRIILTTLELPGGVTAHWEKAAHCKKAFLLVFRAGGRDVGLLVGTPKDWANLQEGELVSTKTWFWQINDGLLPAGVYATQMEAEAAGREEIAE